MLHTFYSMCAAAFGCHCWVCTQSEPAQVAAATAASALMSCGRPPPEGAPGVAGVVVDGDDRI